MRRPATADLISPAVIWLLQLLLTVILFLYFGDIGTLSNKINRQCISFADFASGRRYTGRFIWYI